MKKIDGQTKFWHLRQRLAWYLKQLLPLTYYTTIGRIIDEKNTNDVFVIWRMWLGRSFSVIEFPIDTKLIRSN